MLAGCGGRTTASRPGCQDARARLETIGDLTRASDAAPALRAIIATEQDLLRGSMSTELRREAGRYRGAIARARRALASLSIDPLRSGTMSPTSTIVPATRRALADARDDVAAYCSVEARGD